MHDWKQKFKIVGKNLSCHLRWDSKAEAKEWADKNLPPSSVYEIKECYG